MLNLRDSVKQNAQARQQAAAAAAATPGEATAGVPGVPAGTGGPQGTPVAGGPVNAAQAGPATTPPNPSPAPADGAKAYPLTLSFVPKGQERRRPS